MNIVINGVYKHYKGNYYKVIGMAKHTETLEDLVVYQALYGDNSIWCRPKSMWNEILEVNGRKVNRFELIEDYNGEI